MLMVGTDPLEVDKLLRNGHLRCPGCEGELRPWGHARSRGVRGEGATARSRPQRASCSVCPQTHVLLPAFMLARRADSAAVIGTGLLANAKGTGHRKIAELLGRPVSTVRGWLRRFAARAAHWRLTFTTLLLVGCDGGADHGDRVGGRGCVAGAGVGSRGCDPDVRASAAVAVRVLSQSRAAAGTSARRDSSRAFVLGARSCCWVRRIANTS